MRCQELCDMEHAREHYARNLLLELSREQALNGFTGDLEKVLSPFRDGSCPIAINYRSDAAVSRVRLGDEWRVRPTDELLKRLRHLVGEEQVRVEYSRQ
jgi:DNA polymerase III subunit alpha